MKFLNPVFFIFLPLIALCFWMIIKKKESESVYYSRADELSRWGISSSLPGIFRWLYLAAIMSVFIAGLRPVKGITRKEEVKNARDIFIVMDTSLSMNAVDLKPNRLETAKKEAGEFIKKRAHDRMGLVVFGGGAFIHCPLSFDRKAVLQLVNNIKAGMTLEDGTAIGDGLGVAVKHLAKSESASKIIILLTDGANNRGTISPELASEFAKNIGIKIYAIGVGNRGAAEIPIDHPVFGKVMGRIEDDFNEPLLMKLASDTNGKYYRASSEKSLSEIYGEIDKLEETKILSSSFLEYREYASFFINAAFAFFMAALFLRFAVIRSIP
ncbi:VWA domain-containing protein [bacterium]|nr:VWA domain-containing protein [bacterium]MBU3956150.1 VWA domain-containing protein [bacterium]MBU4133695.1 VWA domain-containing protein [bacterium]